MGFRQFLLRGKEKVQGERVIICLAYNLKRLRNLEMAQAVGFVTGLCFLRDLLSMAGGATG